VNHSTTSSGEQLLIYLGGMAETGKSQVIKALAQFFEHQEEAHQFQLVAPTGAAAAIIGGTTYHSLLGINPTSADNMSTNMISQLKSRLKGTDYILLDEVSMLGAHDLFAVSKHLCLATGRHDKPFGELNMILTGDFAQLLPVSQQTFYSGGLGPTVHATTTPLQETTVGKSLWHLFTTVVILCQNMCQQSQSTQNSLLRTALENMQYKACTQSDLVFLNSL